MRSRRRGTLVKVEQFVVVTRSGVPCDSFSTKASAEKFREYCDEKGTQSLKPYAVVHLTGKAEVPA